MANSSAINRGVTNTAFSPNPDLLAQLTGSGQPVPGSVAPTFAATMAIEPTLQSSRYVEIKGVSTVSATVTITTAFVANPGALLIVNVQASASGTVTATFGTGFKATGTVAATASTNFPVAFVASSSGNWVELARPTAAIAN